MAKRVKLLFDSSLVLRNLPSPSGQYNTLRLGVTRTPKLNDLPVLDLSPPRTPRQSLLRAPSGISSARSTSAQFSPSRSSHRRTKPARTSLAGISSARSSPSDISAQRKYYARSRAHVRSCSTPTNGIGKKHRTHRSCSLAVKRNPYRPDEDAMNENINSVLQAMESTYAARELAKRAAMDAGEKLRRDIKHEAVMRANLSGSVHDAAAGGDVDAMNQDGSSTSPSFSDDMETERAIEGVEGMEVNNYSESFGLENLSIENEDIVGELED